MFSVGYVLSLVAIALFAIYWYLTRNFNYWISRNVPHKKPILFFGNLFDIVLGNQPAGQYLAKLYNEFEGPYFGFFGMDTPFLVIKDPEIIRRVLVKDFECFPNRIFYNNENVDPIVSSVLFGIKSPMKWKSLRAKISPVFALGKLKMMIPLMIECGENMVKYMRCKADNSIETKDLAVKYTVDVIASCGFGISTNSFDDENGEFIVAGRRLFSDTFGRSIQPLSYVFAHKLVKLLGLKFFDTGSSNFLKNVFNRTIQHREQTNMKRHDLIDILIEIKNKGTTEDEYKLDGDRLVSQAIMFFAAGHETTSSAITFTLYELAMNPDIQEKLREEVIATLKLYSGTTNESVHNMKYLNMVVSETLRKYPLTPFLHRESVKDYLISKTGLVIESGGYVLIPTHGLHWDPQFFPEPHKYNPERFSEGNKSNINPYCYLPFGGGPRYCIGERFGLLNVKLGIISILRNFIVEPNSATPNPLVFGRAFLLQCVGGVPLTYIPIDENALS